MLEQRIQQQFFDSADLKYAAADVLTRPIADASHALLGCITAGGKVLTCGNGGSAADAQRFASAFLGGFERERPALQAMCLSGDVAAIAGLGQPGVFDQVFAKQVQALGHPGDLLLVLSSGSAAPNLLAAIDAAHDKDMTVLALVGKEGGPLVAHLHETDVLISVPHSRAARVQEVHLLVLHCLCDAVDVQLLGEHDE